MSSKYICVREGEGYDAVEELQLLFSKAIRWKMS